jgi:2Fe-2S ferredoxin
VKIKFVPQNIEVEVEPGKNLLQVALENNVEIRSLCKGVPSCGECRVKIVSGEHNTVPPTKAEINLIGTSHYIDSRRLACQLRCFGNVTVDASEHVDKVDKANKKVRGFKSQKQSESKAVVDTMILKEFANEPNKKK